MIISKRLNAIRHPSRGAIRQTNRLPANQIYEPIHFAPGGKGRLCTHPLIAARLFRIRRPPSKDTDNPELRLIISVSVHICKDNDAQSVIGDAVRWKVTLRRITVIYDSFMVNKQSMQW